MEVFKTSKVLYRTMKQLLLIIILFSSSLQAQYLNNPSFEGIPTTAISPREWLPYGQASSPDTQPGSWRVNKTASHGSTYITMVARGFSIIDSYLWEGCYQKFQQPLLSNQIYHYSLDLAFAPEFLADTVHFNRPIQLKVYGMNAFFEKELLWESGRVANTDWETYFFEAQPSMLTEYILLEAYYVELPKYNGNILIDNLQYYPKGFSKKKEASLIVIEEPMIINPYVITTTEDGKVDSVNGREVKIRKALHFNSNEITFTVWDNQSFDGDIISLFLNEKCVLDNYLLTKEKHSFTIQLEDAEKQQLTLYAHNVGKIPPNTVSLLVSDGTTKKRMTLSSYLTSCSAVDIVIED